MTVRCIGASVRDLNAFILGSPLRYGGVVIGKLLEHIFDLDTHDKVRAAL